MSRLVSYHYCAVLVLPDGNTAIKDGFLDCSGPITAPTSDTIRETIANGDPNWSGKSFNIVSLTRL